jgi:hypothetical protein
MITRDQALEMARSWTAGLWPDNPTEVGLHEFDHGWVAWPIRPQAQDSTQAQPVAGDPRVVIDRETGDLARWPSIPSRAIAEKYTAFKALGDRFPPDVRMMLDQAGWSPGRDISAAVAQWEVQFAGRLAGMTFYPAARAAMREFGALRIPQAAAPEIGYHSYIFPTAGGVATDRTEGFLEEYEHPVFPLGNYQDGPAELVMDEQGRVFLLHWANDWYLGATIDAALISLVRRGRWPEASDRTWENDQPPHARMNE